MRPPDAALRTLALSAMLAYGQLTTRRLAELLKVRPSEAWAVAVSLYHDGRATPEPLRIYGTFAWRLTPAGRAAAGSGKTS